MAQGGSNKKRANSLVAMSSAAVLAVYAAGYTRTRSAAQQLEAQSVERRPANPAPPRQAPLVAEARPAPVEAAAASAIVPVAAPAAKPVTTAAPEPKTPTPAIPAAKVPAPLPATEPAAPVASEKSAEKKAETVAISNPPAPVPVAPAPAAAAPPPVAPAPVAPAAPVYKDGTYLGWGTSRHGDIQASVVIESGRIAAATIAQCWTRYSCNVIAHLPPQVAQRQSPEVDYVSGATQSANAFYYGVVDALSKAK